MAKKKTPSPGKEIPAEKKNLAPKKNEYEQLRKELLKPLVHEPWSWKVIAKYSAISAVLTTITMCLLLIYLQVRPAKLAQRGLSARAGIIPGMLDPNESTTYRFAVDEVEFLGSYQSYKHPLHNEQDSLDILYLEENPSVNGIPEDTIGFWVHFMKRFVH